MDEFSKDMTWIDLLNSYYLAFLTLSDDLFNWKFLEA